MRCSSGSSRSRASCNRQLLLMTRSSYHLSNPRFMIDVRRRGRRRRRRMFNVQMISTSSLETIKADDFPRGRSSTAGPGVTVVDDEASAERAISVLYEYRDRYHACDTEVAGIDMDKSPIGQGFVTCATIFCGPDVDFGNGPKLFIDNLDDAEGTLDLFQNYFEDIQIKKVWHNYGFDRHVLWNHGIDVQGLGGDTMHMARLWHASRPISQGYSLESLAAALLGNKYKKIPMKERFSKKQLLKNGLPGKLTYLPPIDEIQRDLTLRDDFIDYATQDAETTWQLRNELERRLKLMAWTPEPGRRTQMDFYNEYWVPFGEVLTDMERLGFRVLDENYLPELREKALADIDKYAHDFQQWAIKQIPEAKYMNIYSDAQKQQFFFGGHNKANLNKTREFKYLNTDGVMQPGQARPKKHLPFELSGLGIAPISLTQSGKPQVSSEILKKLAGTPREESDERLPQYGILYEFFGGGEKGKEACLAVDSLNQVNFLTKMLNTFIEPLISMADHNHRVHCSLNLNTETGRLSSRKPNLQNQPALEKDVYKIRAAFSCDPGNELIVADYGQLELRVLAHMANCTSMIEAFKSGGDFHSRTAIGMYPHVAEAVERGDVLLEWDYKKGEPPKPMLKDVYGSERRKAKTLNFSIAYGKTAFGLAKDWGVTKEEAAETVRLWYNDRPEVKRWQDKQIADAINEKVTRTLMGRYRPIPDIVSNDRRVRAHNMRSGDNLPRIASITCLPIKIRRVKRKS
mmetsp:Transcript_27035/g.43449  ORF Transcript_27035/g.43449 Transcript_27035/m.43449 type:complete len:744 (+) Transcript_27035:58-2289(+)